MTSPLPKTWEQKIGATVWTIAIGAVAYIGNGVVNVGEANASDIDELDRRMIRFEAMADDVRDIKRMLLEDKK